MDPTWALVFTVLGSVILLALLVWGLVYLPDIITEAIEERKERGRYRNTVEAHRTGAGGGTVAGTAAGNRPAGGTGTSMTVQNWVSTTASLNSYLGTALYSAVTGKPSPSSTEFSGREFGAGVVTGARSFGVDQLGRLTGVTYRAVWTPAEMEAKCFAEGPPIRDLAADYVGADRHDLASCTHGFYGYYDGSNDYYQEGRVSGIIEGFGETVIGSRGFRCMKARIVALHIPADLDPVRRKLVARNYADVPQFDTFETMVAAFPTDDAGQGVSPATDSDFWTRRV